MRLLFIKLKHIGDALLLTPALVAARERYPQAVIWVVVRKGTEGILAGCPAIDRILTTAAPERTARGTSDWLAGWRMIRELRAQNFDHVFELTDGDRGRWLAVLSGARQRCTNGRGWPLSWWWRSRFDVVSPYAWQGAHRVEKDFFTVTDALPLLESPPPLCFAESGRKPCDLVADNEPFMVLHPGTRWQRKRWSVENWIAVARELGKLVDRLIISTGPAEDELADAAQIQCAIGERALGTKGQLSWAQLAGLLGRARLFVGVDTAAMHLAAACQCPTVALFGPSMEHAWHPWKTEHRVIVPREIPPRVDDPAYFTEVENRGINDVSVDQVLFACRELLSKAP